MTIAIGTDIVEIERLQSVMARQGVRFAERILTKSELTQFHALTTDDSQLHFLAKRWCAKESIAKALGTGIAKGIGWHTMEIVHDDLGAPAVNLSDAALERLKEIGGQKVLISISDERHYALAFSTVV